MSDELERGDVYFFYRPRVGATEVDDLQDVQRFFFVLQPDGTGHFRRLIVGRKRLPDPEQHERVWAFVADVGDDPTLLRAEVAPAEYPTTTRGWRREPGARPAGEGRYALVEHERHTHLAYVLELPAEPGPVQQAFRIGKQASYIAAVRNPEAPAPAGVGLPPGRRPHLPDEFRQRFGGRRFIPVNPPDLLDYVGAEIVLIGASWDVGGELGIELDAERERVETAEIFARLGLRPEELSIDPLVRGTWR
jgi:hypothetical protein